MRKLLLALALTAAPLGIAACGGSSTTAAGGSTVASADCAKASLATKTPGTLTFSTDNPAFPPWYGGGEKNKPWKINDPSTGEGYESAVAAAVATKLGFAATEVKWIVTPFDKSFAPGPKDFDVFINQVCRSTPSGHGTSTSQAATTTSTRPSWAWRTSRSPKRPASPI